MDRLAMFIALMAWTAISGTLIIIAFTMEWYGWMPILGSVVIALVLAWPVGYVISRRIKRRDPNWPPRRRRNRAVHQ